jgi:hypothetical protein
MNTQKQNIIKALKTGWISPLDALKKAGTMKLATRVGELRQEGYLILDQWHESRKFKIYRLVGIKK